MTRKEIKVELWHGEAFIIEGHKHCYKSEKVAMSMAKRVTARPAVMGLIYNNRRLYLAVGDSYIGEGEGSYLYGKAGALVSLVVAQPE